MQRECRSPESCIYAVGVVGEGSRVHQHGTLEVTPSQLIYTPEGEQDSYIWPLRFIKHYSCEGDEKFVIETSSQCPSGTGLYTFSTQHAAELHSIVARNTATIVTSPKHIRTSTDSQTTPPTPPTFAPLSPSFSSSPNFLRSNGVMSPHSPSLSSPYPYRNSRSSLSPTSSPILSRSPSVRSLPENAFEVKNIGEDESVIQDGILEVTSQELIYIENSSQQKWVWPLMFLRRYGCSGNLFSIEAGRRCPGGPGYYSFSTPRIAELYELVQSYAKNLYSSQMSLCSMDYSSNITSPPGQVSYSHSHSPNPGSEGRSESPVFHRSDSFIRRAFSAMELRKNVFEVHNLDDNQQVLGKGMLEVTNSDLVYIDSTTGEKWRWPIKYLRRYGCNGVRVFSFEAGRRCPGGEGLYAFATSSANEIHEAIVESVNTNSSNQMQRGNLSVSRLSLADAGMQSSRNGWSRKSSVPVVSSSSHFLTPPPLRRPSQPTLDESPSSHQHTSTPTRQSVSSDDTDIIDGGSELPSGTPPPNPPSQSPNTLSPPPNTLSPPSNPPTDRKFKNHSLPPDFMPPGRHTYDIPQEAKDEYLKRNNSDSKLIKSGQKKKKKPMIPPPYRAGTGKQAFQQLMKVGQQQDNSPKNAKKRLNGHTDPVQPNVLQAEEQGGSFYQNIQVRTPPKSSETTPQLSRSLPNHESESVVPQPSESHYANLSSYQSSGTPPATRNDSQSEGNVYANLADINAEIESGRSNSTPSSPSTLASSSYAEVEIIDIPHSHSETSPDSTAWSPSSPSEKRRDSALNSSIGGCGTTVTKTTENSNGKTTDVQYDYLDFNKMKSLKNLKEHRGDTQNFAELLERHSYRDRETSGSRKKK